VPGREYSALATRPGARQPHRVLVQVPDGFDRARRCVVVAASSGSRGVYGAISVAGAWGLPKGCAVAYTDKGAGTDYVDLDAGTGVRTDGTVAPLGTPGLAFTAAGGRGVAFKHAHSGDNPEADWGRHVRDAAEYALVALGEAFPDDAPFRFDDTTVIAVGISNGGGAVLRAAEIPGGWLDAVVAGEPNVYVEGDRPLYDVATEAALLMPCALLALDGLPQPPLQAQVRPQWTAQCAALRAAGLVEGADAEAQARDALARLRAAGWSDAALRAGALSVGFDLWRAVAATYASAYGRYGAADHPCGLQYAALDQAGAARPATATERAAWSSDGSGIPPGAGVGLVGADGRVDTAFTSLQCLRGLWTGTGPDAQRVRAGIGATRVSPPRHGLPVFVIHGTDDGLVPMAFTSTPYVAMARAAGADVRFWQVRNAQHFDGFLGLPDYGARYVPMLPYVYAALDSAMAHLELGTSLPGDAEVRTEPRAGAALEARHLAIPEVPLR
jgi:hydroxybutyrate-dimer hydrolase